MMRGRGWWKKNKSHKIVCKTKNIITNLKFLDGNTNVLSHGSSTSAVKNTADTDNNANCHFFTMQYNTIVTGIK